MHQFARELWDAGHRSCASIAHAKSELAVQLGEDIEDLIAFCGNRSGMHACVSGMYQHLRYREMCLLSLCKTDVAVLYSRSELLKSTLPKPIMSTSPSGMDQAEVARPSHPESVEAFDVAPTVLAYIATLPATPERFKLPDRRKHTVRASPSCMQLVHCSGMSCNIDLTTCMHPFFHQAAYCFLAMHTQNQQWFCSLQVLMTLRTDPCYVKHT